MGLEDGPGHRESYLHCFLYLTGQVQGQAQGQAQGLALALAFVPERHRRITVRIYENLGRRLVPLTGPLETDEGSNGGTGERPSGVYTVSFDRGLLKGVVRVSLADVQQWPEILRTGTDLLDIAGAEVVHIDLPLAQPATERLCELTETAFFFLAGIWPHAAQDGDMLWLSRPAAPLDMNLLRLHSDCAPPKAQRGSLISAPPRVKNTPAKSGPSNVAAGNDAHTNPVANAAEAGTKAAHRPTFLREIIEVAQYSPRALIAFSGYLRTEFVEGEIEGDQVEGLMR